MGSPMVFQTAPPQPASKARITWPAVFDGGPEASQKGFGDSMPQNFTFRSAIAYLLTGSAASVDQLFQANHATVANIPSQPIARTHVAIFVALSSTPSALKRECQS